MKLPKFDYLNLATTYILFGLIYGVIVAVVWNYLFEPISNIHLSVLQGFGIHLITRILFGNTNTNYISNFYSKESFDLDKIDEKIKDIKEDLDLEEERIEDELNQDK